MKENWFETFTEKYNKNGYTLRKQNDGYYLEGHDLKNFGTSANMVWTAYSLLCDEVYHFSDPSKSTFVLIDIGLNIGISALYFAKKPEIVHIYGYEPFLDSFNQALHNIDINPTLKDKISTFQIGLSNKNEQKSLHYNAELPGSMSTCFDRFVQQGIEEKIELKEASTALKTIFEKHKEKIILKMDCEGAESEIIPNLFHSGLLQKISIIIMEWHFINPKIYIEILNKCGFFVFNSNEHTNYQGIIKAINLNQML